MTQIIKRANKASVCLTLLLCLLFSCTGELPTNEAEIPVAPVRLRIGLNHEGRKLLEPLSFMTFTEPILEGDMLGHGGLLVAHHIGTGAEVYSAFDLICPYDWPEKVALLPLPEKGRDHREYQGEKGTTPLLAFQCPKCHTTYDLTFGIGNPVSGPGKHPLIQYRIILYDNTLHIHNH